MGREDDLGPATAVWLGLVGAALGANVVLIRLGYPPLTAVARHPVARLARAYFDLHVDRALGPADAFTVLGRLIGARP